MVDDSEEIAFSRYDWTDTYVTDSTHKINIDSSQIKIPAKNEKSVSSKGASLHINHTARQTHAREQLTNTKE